jgi:CheY-like chemotaxis protein
MLRGLRIFLVEDEGPVAMLIEDMLDELGCRVVASAASVAEALSYVAQDEFDLALLDINVAGERIDPVVAVLQSRGIPIIFASGYGTAGLQRDWQDVPILQKPFRLQQLKELLSANRSAGPV